MFNYLKCTADALKVWKLEEKINSVQIEKFWTTLELVLNTRANEAILVTQTF